MTPGMAARCRHDLARHRFAGGSSASSMPMIRDVRWLCVVLAWALASGARAAAATSVTIEDLTWTELREQIRAGRTTIIVPVGGTEQNGPYIALGKHNVRVKALAEKVAV